MKMKKIQSILLIGILSLNLTLPVFGAEFTDSSQETDTTLSIEEDVAKDTADLLSDSEDDISAFSAEPEEDAFTSEVSEDYEIQETEGLVYEYMPELDGYRLIRGVDQETVKIPGTHLDKPVLEIGEDAFANSQNLKYVGIYSLDSKIITIRQRAFQGCYQLRAVSLNVAYIESHAFWNCPRLATLNTAQQQFGTIADDAFDPDTKVLVTSYGGFPYKEEGYPYYAEDIESGNIQYSEGMVEISHYWKLSPNDSPVYTSGIIDYDDSKATLDLTHSLDYVEVIGRKAFYGCSNLKEIVLPTDLKRIETKAFFAITNLKEVRIPAGVTEIADDAFENCLYVTFSVTKGSYAESYAKEHNIDFIYTPVAPKIKSISINKNMITVNLDDFSGDVFYCVLGNAKNRFGEPVRTRSNARIAENQDGNKVTFKNIYKGTYYIGLKSVTKVDGKEYESPWSEVRKIKITSITPSRPVAPSVKVSGRKLTITVKRPKDATGYNVTLAKKTVNSDSSTAAVRSPGNTAYRLLNQTKKTVTMKNIKPGTYYVCVQPYRTQGKNKVYGQWAPMKKVTIK
ncbi:leucine-rich repeat domain-containing protein [Blautia schinkii]|nr:leucine-rich repeat domain-containing protein [Blautia schinkii]